MSHTTLPDSNPGLLAQAPLGKAATYVETYSPNLLFPLERAAKRAEIGLTGPLLPFIGDDVWQGYELSWLDTRGKPHVALARFTFPADSPRLVESKSFKLYLNSFNQTQVADLATLRNMLVKDLSAAAGAAVKVVVMPISTSWPVRHFAAPALGILLDEYDLDIDTYAPNPDFLTLRSDAVVEETLYSHLLKSNCPVTGQPDWGMVAVSYKGPALSREGLLRYIISFRQHNEFHEQCVERIFMEILTRCRPTALSVWACYTRRGGLDINPWRATPGQHPPPTYSEIRQ